MQSGAPLGVNQLFMRYRHPGQRTIWQLKDAQSQGNTDFSFEEDWMLKFAQAVPIIKKNLIEACIHVGGADGVIVESEAELLRAISDTLDCPMPPFVAAS